MTIGIPTHTAPLNSFVIETPQRIKATRFLLIALLLLIASSAARSQETLPSPTDLGKITTLPDIPDHAFTANIRGTITDRDGAVYQDVKITLSLAPAQPDPALAPLEKTTTTDANGGFQFEALPPGSFRLSVSANGFASQVIPGQLHSGELLTMPPITLLVSSATSQVEVTASGQDIAQAQLKQEEQQRIFGAVPNFYVVYAPNAQPLSPRQKFHLAWRSSIDPVSFLASGFFAGIEQANNQFSGYGQGAQGYAKRFGANYADNFIETMIGNALLPAWWKQDPRYFYKGTGTTHSRVLYALKNSVMCKGDNGNWQFNYSGIIGGLASGGISNLYYPASNRNGVGLTFENTGIGIVGTAAQNLVQEFLFKRLTPKVPNYSPSQP